MSEKKLDVDSLKKSSTPFKAFNMFIIAIGVIVFIKSWIDTEMSIAALLDGWEHMVAYLSGNPEIKGSSYFPPALDGPDILKYTKSIIETVEMAVIALVLSVIVAVPLSIMSSRNMLNIMLPRDTMASKIIKQVIYFISTLIANICRSINEMVWALIFVSAVGLGAMAGIMALGVHTAGVLSKLLSEGNEAIDLGPVKALEASGAGFIKILVYAVLPQTMPHFVSMTLYRFESDVRSASILGFVGAGGIGFYLFDKLRSFENADVCTILILIVVTVFIIDKLSAIIRQRFI